MTERVGLTSSRRTVQGRLVGALRSAAGRSNGRVNTLLALTAIFAPGGSTFAQTVDPGSGGLQQRTAASVTSALAAQPAPAPAGEAALDPKEFAARSVTRLALLDVRVHSPLTPADFQVALALLEIASEFAPQDLDLVRLRSVIAQNGEQWDTLEPLFRRLLAADPGDTAAQYRLITLRLNRIQLSEDRLRAYERFLGPDGAGLDASIRSRLASDAAFLHRERGEAQGFVDKLKLATSLDPTNKDAAKAALEYFDQRVDDPIGRLDLIANLMYADIADADTHEELARALASVGVFDGARRFSGTAQKILDRAGLSQDALGFLSELATDWCVDGAASVTQRLSVALASRRQETESLIKQLQAQLVPTDDIPRPEDVRLDARLDRVRLLAARTAGDQATIEAATGDVRKSYDAALAEMKKMVPSGQITEQDLAEQSRALKIELVTLLAHANVDLDAAAKDLDTVAAEADNDATEPGFREARAWVSLRQGAVGEAMGLFEPLSIERSVSRIGLAACQEAQGQKQAAISTYRGIVREFPITVESAWAVGRLIELTGSPEVDPALTPQARRFYAALPAWIGEVSTDPSRFMSLGVELTRPSAHNLERSEIQVRLTNISSVPLGVGPGETIDSRAIVAPQLEIGTDEVRSTQPEVLDLQRRLRLLPNQSIAFTCWPDPGVTGWIMETNCREAARVRFRVIQGFVRGGQGEVLVGPMSLSCGTSGMIRSPLPESMLAPEDFARRVADAPEQDLPRLVTVGRALLFADKGTNTTAGREAKSADAALSLDAQTLLTPGERSALARAFADRYAKASVPVRAIMLAGLPHASQFPEMSVFDEAARPEADPSLAALFIVSRVGDEQDPALAAAKSSPDARLARIAQLHAQRTADGKPPYAKLGPGYAGLLTAAVPQTPGPAK